ncbi:MAG: 2-C-methyl-D-erythritol 2,4-cyclodiphosphate synthase [Oscillospiraceae bacterium]|nr:2-C-methyl-D-erythritol 2,4-cyclodiphosphate synthase [Oscillospiraceae bacterium]
MRIGFGYDVHKLVEGRKCIICGVDIPHDKGLLGHSDADVAIHALCDAILGAAALGDIGRLFPDTDERFKGIDSRILLRHVMERVNEAGYRIGNVDITIAAQKPKMMPHIEKMRQNIAETLDCEINAVSIKATTTEKLGFEGREEGISAYAVALLQ